MLARLVVHLQSNYGSLQTGLVETAQRADHWSNSLSAAAGTADALDAAATSLAFTAQNTSAALGHLSRTTATLHSTMAMVDKGTVVANQGLRTIATTSGIAAPVLMKLSTTAGSVSQMLTMVAGGARTVGSGLSIASQGAGMFAGALGTVSTWISATIRFIELLLDGLGVLLIPLQAVGAVGLMAFRGLTAAVSLALMPFRALWALLLALGRAVWAVVQPLLSMALTVAKVWFLFKGWIAATKLILHWLSLMPPKVRLLVGGLMALGLAGRVGTVALSVMAGAVRITTSALKLLLLPLLAIRNPLAAGRVAFSLLTGAMLRAAGVAKATASAFWRVSAATAGMAARGTASMASFAGRGLKAAAGAVNSLVGSLVTAAAKTVLLAAAVGIGWGGMLAADAEQAQVAFTTMLRDGNAAKALLQQIETFSAQTPFQLADLRQGAQNMLAFGFASGEIMNRLEMLGNIASGTGKPIDDFVQIFGKVKATGKVSLESLNQLAERGVPIYSALAQTLGVSRSEMLQMISKGKVGFAQLDAAMQSTTAAGGIFAGGMAAQSQTVSGLMSTLKDNVGMALMTLSQILMDAFDFKGMMADGITFAQQARTWFTALTPVIFQLATTVKASLGFVWQFWSAVWKAIFGESQATFRDITEIIVTALAMAEFGFLNWQDVGMLALMTLQLKFMQFGGWLNHLFGTELPAYISHFASNWRDTLFTVFDYATTVFINLGQNIRNIMGEIWDYIASAGKDSIELAWTPLSEGFVSTLKDMEAIPERALHPLEVQLQSQIDGLGTTLENGMTDLVAERLAALDAFQSPAQKAVDNLTANLDQPVDEQQPAAGTETKGAGALLKGSGDAMSAIFAAMRAQTANAQTKASQQTAQNTSRIAAGIDRVAQHLTKTTPVQLVEAF